MWHSAVWNKELYERFGAPVRCRCKNFLPNTILYGFYLGEDGREVLGGARVCGGKWDGLGYFVVDAKLVNQRIESTLLFLLPKLLPVNLES